MHSSTELRSSMFTVSAGGRRAGLGAVLPDFGERDRLGVVVRDPCGAVGASALVTAAVTAFYDAQRARGDDFFIYPDYYLFHVGRPFGDHSMLDVWPGHKEVVVADDPDAILEAVNDRGVTRLAVPDRPPREPAPDFAAETLASARGRIVTCLAYGPDGRVAGADVEIASNPVTEGYVRSVLDAEGLLDELRADGGDGGPYARSIAARAGEVDRATRMAILEARAALVEDGVPVETYRRLGLDEALARL